MSVAISFHGLEEARAQVYQAPDLARPWFVTLYLDAVGARVELYTAGAKTKVEAIMAAFEMVESFKAALTKMNDVVLHEDMEASPAERKLIEGGSEALPEAFLSGGAPEDMPDTVLTTTPDPAAEARAKATAGITVPESVLIYDLSGPDGPVADSVDGYKVTAEEIRAETGEEPKELVPGKLVSGEDDATGTVRKMGDHFEEGA